jgi:two-component system cell cycle response regulator CtrA
MSLRDSYIETLEAENDTLRERIRELEAMLGMSIDAPLELGLTGTEARMFGLLRKVELASKKSLMTALYWDRIDDAPHEKIVDVMICHLRRKLKPWKIEIETAWGQGYAMQAASKKIANALFDRAGAIAKVAE